VKVDYFAAPDAKALVVDDFPINLEVAKEMLAPYNIKVYCALSGRQAVRLIQEGKIKYDIVFMDHMMPEMDGMETVKIIRGLEGAYAKAVPIVALTACADESQAGQFLSNGFQAFLTKPINPVKLNAVLREWLAGDGPREAGPPSDDARPSAPLSALNEALLMLFAHARVSGVNLVEAAGRYNDADTYARVLDSFKRNVSKQVLDLLRARTDLSSCAILAHGIKGGSYGVGAKAAGEAAEAIENAAKAGDGDAVSKALVPFANQMEQLIADLEQLLEQARRVREEHTAGILKEPDKALLRDMRDAAEQFDASRMRKVMEQIGAYVYDADNDLVDWLRQKVSDFDYEAIRERLAEA
jgi:CheY-like chemotaxis protein